MSKLAQARHSYGGSNFHLEFTPKYRRVVFESSSDENGLMEWMPNQTTANGVFFAKFVFEGNQATSRAVLLR